MLCRTFCAPVWLFDFHLTFDVLVIYHRGMKRRCVMQGDKFTAIVRNAIGTAQTAALSANHQKLTGEHILAALLKDDNMTVKMLIRNAGGDSASLLKRLDANLAKLP
jgi:anti-sigma factor ChrR (cupin superfamily)